MALTSDEKLLALGRENGQIEIYRLTLFASTNKSSTPSSIFRSSTWTMIHTIPGIKSSGIRNIIWYEPDFITFSKPTNNPFLYNSSSGDVCPRRLITTGLNGAVIERDFITNQPRKIIDLGDVAIWDCAKHNDQLYLACDDGAIRIISLESFSELKRLPSVNVR